MGRLSVNLKKTYNYLKSNGVSATVYEVRERMSHKGQEYVLGTPDPAVLEEQWSESGNFEYRPLISVIVPLYNSDEKMLGQLIDSVASQSYDNWEIIFADGSETEALHDKIKNMASERGIEMDSQIVYSFIGENKGISGNTNCAIELAKGDYCALVDHDDIIEPDAFFEIVKKLNECVVDVLYTDEDKCDESGEVFYDPTYKPDFDPVYLLCNNYICHLTVIKTELLKRLKMRPEYDGAQDHDLLLRATGAGWDTSRDTARDTSWDTTRDTARDTARDTSWDTTRDTSATAPGPIVVHIPRVLYHWRVFGNSTSGNTRGKFYAYEAGRSAVADRLAGMQADRRTSADVNKSLPGESAKMRLPEVYHTKHVGVYGIDHLEDPMVTFEKVGAVGGLVVKKKKNGKIIAGPVMRGEDDCPFVGMPSPAGGEHNRRFISMECDALDIRCMKINKELRTLFEEITGVKYVETGSSETGSSETKNPEAKYFEKAAPVRFDLEMGNEGKHAVKHEWETVFDPGLLPAGTDYAALSRKLCEEIRKRGYRLIYIPEWETIWKQDSTDKK